MHADYQPAINLLTLVRIMNQIKDEQDIKTEDRLVPLFFRLGFTMKYIMDETLNVLQNTAKEKGLTTLQIQILQILEIKPKITIKKFGDLLNQKIPNIVKQINNLEKKELVKRVRQDEDRRVKRVELTQKGIKTAGEIPQFNARQIVKDMLTDINPDKSEQLITSIETILTNLNLMS